MTKKEKYLILLAEITEFIEDYGKHSRRPNLMGYETNSYTLYFNSNILPHGRWQLMVWDERKDNRDTHMFSCDIENYDGLVELFSRPELFGILKTIAYRKLLTRLTNYILKNGTDGLLQCGDYIFSVRGCPGECVYVQKDKPHVSATMFNYDSSTCEADFDQLMKILNEPKLLHILKEISK